MSRQKRDWLFRVYDMLRSIEQIGQIVSQTNPEEFANHFMFSNSVIRDLEIIGEAAKHIPPDITSRYDAVPWQDIKDMRNVLIHEYFGVNLKVVWNTATLDIPNLKSTLLEILENHGDI